MFDLDPFRFWFVRFWFRLHNTVLIRRKTSYLEHGSGGVGLGTLLTFELLVCHVAGLVVFPQALLITRIHSNNNLLCSIVDQDPYVFGPPRSGSVIITYGSGSFHKHAKK
jgi:hypothetical protein